MWIFSTEVRYLGYVVNKQGLKPDPDRISAIQKMPEPQNISELRSFLGAINFYSKFVNNMRALRGLLDELHKTDVKWHWKLKEILSSNLLWAHYDPTKSIIVAADPSNYGLRACILHEYANRTVKAICHASRSLTPSEKSYSPIEKEAL